MVSELVFNELDNIMVNSLSHNPEIIIREDYMNIYSVFVRFLRMKYKEDYPSVNQFLEGQLCRFDIVASCVEYIDNGRPHAKSAVSKFLNAMTLFYNNYFIPNNLSNRNLAQIVPFSGLNDEIHQKIQKKLHDNNPYPALSEQGFSALVEYISSFKKFSKVEKEIFLIWRLILLFGFKLERINSFEIRNFDNATHSLSITGFDNDTITLELPTKLSENMNEYIESIKPRNEGYIFLTTKNETIEPSYFTHHFDKLKRLSRQSDKSSSFCTTGLAKYAICQMLHAGLDTYFIQRITGMDANIIQYCQEEVFNTSKDASTKNELIINEKLKSIPTYNKLY